ncbi:MAG TPA: Fur family transcriptional regulator [Anaerolineales bacterium]|nr:Fur family transcriptional regulator [Anaerolineales bacterium]
MSCVSEYVPQFRARGFRMTPQRMTILHVLRHAGGHLSPAQVYELSRKDLPGLTEATVYRTLEFLTEQGFVLAAHMGGGKIVYELANANHHHLICRNCGRSVAIEHAPLGSLYRQLEASTGYKLDSTHVTLFGLCPDCQNSLN